MSTKQLFCRMAFAAAVPFALSAAPAFAAPMLAGPSIEMAQLPIEQARADCYWVDNRWTYQRGDKRLVCRPDRPRGGGWSWHRAGNRHGWYHNGRKSWNHRNW